MTETLSSSKTYHGFRKCNLSHIRNAGSVDCCMFMLNRRRTETAWGISFSRMEELSWDESCDCENNSNGITEFQSCSVSSTILLTTRSYLKLRYIRGEYSDELILADYSSTWPATVQYAWGRSDWASQGNACLVQTSSQHFQGQGHCGMHLAAGSSRGWPLSIEHDDKISPLLCRGVMINANYIHGQFSCICKMHVRPSWCSVQSDLTMINVGRFLTYWSIEGSNIVPLHSGHKGMLLRLVLWGILVVPNFILYGR